MKSKVVSARTALAEASTHAPHTALFISSDTKLSNQLRQLVSGADPLLGERISMFGEGAVDICMEVARTEQGKHLDSTLESAWWVLSCCMEVKDANDGREYESVRMGVDKGLVELAVWEIGKDPLRNGGKLADNAFMTLINAAGQRDLGNRLLQAGVVELCVALVRRAKVDTETNISILDGAIITLASLALSHPDTLRATTSGVIESMIPLLRMLSRGDNDTLKMLGFKGARGLIRLVGKDETSRVVRDNGVILDTYEDIIAKALASGPTQGFAAYNMSWKLAGLAVDLSLISLSDTNKPLLARFVPHILDMLALYGKDDGDLLHHGLVFLSQVTFNEECLVKLVEGKDKVDKIRTMTRSVKVMDAETTSLLAVVVNAVFPSAVPAAARRPSVLQRVANVVKGTTTNTKPQVMISYHQKSTGGHAQALVKMLEGNGYRTWIDTRDMRGDVQEAMSMAVQSSDVVMVLVSVGYKESANCRLECQYAFKRDVPVLFVVCEETYKNPDGWLGLLMGQTMWVGIFTVAMVDTNAAEVVRRVKETIDGIQAPVTAPPVHHHGASASSAALDEIREIMKAQAAKIDTQATKIDAQTSEIAALKVQLNKLETALKAMGGKLE